MSREVLILREPEIRALLDPRLASPPWNRLLLPTPPARRNCPRSFTWMFLRLRTARFTSRPGTCDGGPYYAVKIVSGFLNNPKLGLPANDGMVVLFDAKTGAPAAFLLDNGFITDFRTGAAGAVAAKYLARKKIAKSR